MDFLELAQRRFSARKYQDTPVEREKLDKILEAGRAAPTSANSQPQRILVVESRDNLMKLESGLNPYHAPLALIVCANVAESFHNPFTNRDTYEIDVAIVATHMMLEAADLGLATTWIGEFDVQKVKTSFYIPEEYEPICILLIGCVDREAAAFGKYMTTRRPLEETVFFETF